MLFSKGKPNSLKTNQEKIIDMINAYNDLELYDKVYYKICKIVYTQGEYNVKEVEGIVFTDGYYPFIEYYGFTEKPIEKPIEKADKLPIEYLLENNKIGKRYKIPVYPMPTDEMTEYNDYLIDFNNAEEL